MTTTSFVGLAFYDKVLGEPLTYDNASQIRPFRVTMDGLLGGCIVKKTFLHNDNPRLYFTDILVSIQDESESGLLYSSGNWGWKLISSIHEPVPEEWEQVADNNILSLDDIGSSSRADVTSYFPIWIWCKVPSGLLAQNITDLKLFYSAYERLVG